MKNNSSLLTLTLFALLLLQAALLFLVFSPPPGPTVVSRTAIPPLRQATLPPANLTTYQNTLQTGECEIAALDLLAAWAAADAPELETFSFNSVDGKNCQTTYTDSVAVLFHEPNLWYGGAIACTSCHGDDVTRAAANLSLVDHASILSGSRRTDSQAKGQDILGLTGPWNQSKLYVQIFTRQMPIGRPFESPQAGPLIRVGTVE